MRIAIRQWLGAICLFASAGSHSQALLETPSRACAPATAAANPSLCVAAERIALPETRVSVAIPEGYTCSADSTVWMRMVSCLPVEGGLPFELQKLFGSHVPKSLDAQLEESRRVSVAHPENRVREPRRVTLSGHDAIQQTTSGEAFFDGPDLHSTGQLATDSYLIQDGADFYTCTTTAGLSQLSTDLRRKLHAFCDSLAFTN